jgi:hypothetical protein
MHYFDSMTASTSTLRENKTVLYSLLFKSENNYITQVMGHGLNSVHQFVSSIATTNTFGQDSQDRHGRKSQRGKTLRKAKF